MKHVSKFIAAFILALCIWQAPAQAETVLNRGNSVEPQTLDPHKASLVQEANVAYELFEGLLTYDAKANLKPGVAESWTVSDDKLTYTFNLRKDAVWSDGTPLTADDFVYAWQRVANPATGSYYSSMLFVVKNGEDITGNKKKPEELGVRAIDAHTFEVTLKQPTLYFLETLVNPATYPVPKAIVEKHGSQWIKPGNLVSNGAFILKDFIPKDSIRLVKNPKFHDAANVKIDALNYIPIEDRGAALKRFEAGEIDSYDDVLIEQMDHVKTNLADQFVSGPYLGTYYFWYKNDKAPFNDPKLRRALSMMIDRDYLAEKIWGGLMTPAYSLVPPGMPDYTPVEADFAAMSPIEREDEAKKLMAELGYGPDKPLKIELRFNTSENHRNTSVEVANRMKPFGVEATLLNTDGKTHYGHLRQHGDFDLARANWIGDYRDPQTFLLITTSNDGHNYGVYSNKTYDDAVVKASLETDPAKRNTLMQEAEKIAVNDQPMMILLHYRSKNLLSKKVTGWETNNMDAHLSRYLGKSS